MLPKTNIAFVLLLALLALLVPKAGIEDDVDVPAKPVVVADGANGDLLSPNVMPPPPADPNARLVGFCVPKVLVVEEVPKVPALAGVEFVPNMGTGVFLSVEPNILVVPPKPDVACDVPTLDVPNAGVVLLVLSKPGVIVPVETFPILNVDAVVPACVVGVNNGDVVLPNIPPVVPKDGDFVCPKIGELLPNIKGAVVVEVKLALALANKLELIVLFDEGVVLVVVTKSESTVVVGLLNIPVVPGTVDAVPKND